MIKIRNIKIGKKNRPVIIAEMSGNHNHSLERALKIVDHAAKSGAQMLKIQTYTAETMTVNSSSKDFFINDKKSPWNGKNLYDLYKTSYTPWDWHKKIFERCKKRGIIGFSTPFDESAVDFLEKLNVPVYKIASFENTHLPLIKKIALTKKPVIISTGLASKKEIFEAINVLKKNGCRKYILMKCTSEYPASNRNSNVLTIPDLEKIFKCYVGLSDHTKGIGVSLAAIAHGAVLIEKHFTLKREDGGVDSNFSIEPFELNNLVKESFNVWESLGKVFYGPTEAEINSLKFRRSIYVTKDLKKGELFSKNNIKIIRPGYGLAPKYFERIIGLKAKKNLKKHTALSWSFIKRSKK
jgi:pseudaminic acid synthase